MRKALNGWYRLWGVFSVVLAIATRVIIIGLVDKIRWGISSLRKDDGYDSS